MRVLLHLYEGTTGIQALDLLGRKVLLQSRGKAVRDFTAEILSSVVVMHVTKICVVMYGI
jgi:hypothetical protein